MEEHASLRLLARGVIAIGRRMARLAGAAALPLLVMTIPLAGSPCTNEILAEHPSPDGRVKAVVFVRGCRDPARFSTQVSVIKAARPLGNVAGNVFISGVRYAATSADLGGPEIEVVWESEDRLVVVHPPETEVLKARGSFKRVRIRYEESDD